MATAWSTTAVQNEDEWWSEPGRKIAFYIDQDSDKAKKSLAKNFSGKQQTKKYQHDRLEAAKSN